MEKDKTKITDLVKFEDSYTEESLWYKIKRFAKKAGVSTVYYVLVLYNLLKSDELPLTYKAMIIGALGYFITPLDLIPDLLPGTGFVDDATVLLMVLKQLKEYINGAIKQAAKEQLKEWFEFNDQEIDDLLNWD